MKKTPTKKDKETPSIRILKKASCKSTSGIATLGYRIGCDDEGSIYLSIHENSGNGFFSSEWLRITDIQDALENASAESDSITSIVLQPLFQGKSVNTPSFLLAALANERVIVPHEGKQRHYQLGDIDAFIENTNKLMTSKGPTKKTSTRASKATTKKVSGKKAALKKKRSTTTAK